MQTIRRNTTNITFSPHPLQWFINELPLVVLAICGLAYAGMEDSLCPTLSFSLSFAVALVALYRLLYIQRVVYRISEEQLICEHGIFMRQVNYMELYRVVDFYEHRSFMQQLFGLKTVNILSTDRSTPLLKLLGVKASKDIVSIIRERVLLARERRHIYEVANR